MTPQELMDMDGAGNAERRLRRMNKWKLTKIERLEVAIGNLMSAVDTAYENTYDLERIMNEEETT